MSGTTRRRGNALAVAVALIAQACASTPPVPTTTAGTPTLAPYVEKDANCAEISNRTLTVSYGGDGTQTVEDTVANWRNVTGCPN